MLFYSVLPKSAISITFRLRDIYCEPLHQSPPVKDIHSLAISTKDYLDQGKLASSP